MCGIFGVIHFDDKPVDQAKAIEAAKTLAHRGPDDYGTFLSTSGNAFFCHYRLSIIELSKLGHQPMTTDDRRYTILFNGEIYNYKEIRNPKSNLPAETLVKAGIRNLKSDSDTEVLLNLYADYGEESLNKLRGMFAFAVWDEKEKSLFAARDRFGIKPFYYLHNENEFIFSSELKAIKTYKKNLTVSEKGVDAFLRTGSVPAPLTIYNETRSLMPGEYVIAAGGKIQLKKWWGFEKLVSNGNKYSNEAKEEIKNELISSVKAHCVSDVEVGAFLSGGVDSTSIVSLMKQIGQEKVRTISVIFPGNKLDESNYARLAANKYDVEHTEYPLTESEVIDDLNKFFDAIDQPTVDGLNTYFVSKAAASLGLKVVMSGLGGDELFGGYPSFKHYRNLNLINQIPASGVLMNAAIPFSKSMLPAKAIEYFRNPQEENSIYKLFRGLFTEEELRILGWHSPTHSENDLSFEESLSSNLKSKIVIRNSPLQYVSFMESTNYMANQLLRDSDVFSMAHSLELRVPFVDNRLYAGVLKYLDNGYNKKYPKKLLTDAVGDIPSELVNREKMGFTFPFADWIMKGEFNDIMKDTLLNGEITRIIDSKAAGELLRKFNEGKVKWSRIWALFILDRFM
jgi:asparagine synthase (glutamine-hydrolysing)